MKNKLTIIGLSLVLMLGSISGFAQTFDGFALYNKTKDNFTYLVDKEGDIVKT